jgi:hypothetical protein
MSLCRDLALLPFRTPKTAEARRRNAEMAMRDLGEFTGARCGVRGKIAFYTKAGPISNTNHG